MRVRFGQRALGRQAAWLLHLGDTPERTAAAFALGVTIGFSPFVGVQALLGLALAFAIGLNRIAVVAGTFTSLPWIMPPYYAATTMFGAWLTRTAVPAGFLTQLDVAWHVSAWPARMTALATLLRPLLWSYLLGSSLVAAALGVSVYHLTLALLRSRKALVPGAKGQGPDV